MDGSWILFPINTSRFYKRKFISILIDQTMSKQIIICQQGKCITLWCLNKYGTPLYPSFQHQNKNVNTYSVFGFGRKSIDIVNARVGASMVEWLKPIRDIKNNIIFFKSFVCFSIHLNTIGTTTQYIISFNFLSTFSYSMH